MADGIGWLLYASAQAGWHPRQPWNDGGPALPHKKRVSEVKVDTRRN
jgi:hypothetical protein